MPGVFKSKTLDFTRVSGSVRKWEVRVKGGERVVAYVFGQAGNKEYRYRMASNYGRYSVQMTEASIVQALMRELNL